MSEPWPGCSGVLWLVTEPSPNIASIVAEAVLGGVNVVYLRDKSASLADAKQQARSLIEVIHPYALLLTALPLGAAELGDGVHLSENDVALLKLRKQLAPSTLIGCSVHSTERARQVEKEGADYVLAGTIFASQSHPGTVPAGINFLHGVCEALSVPVIAIGGIAPERVGDCIAAGAAGVAVLSPIMRAADPRAVAHSYRTELDKAWSLRSTENQ